MQKASDLFPTITDAPTRDMWRYPELISDHYFVKLYDEAKEYSLVHIPGFYNLYQSMNYIKRMNIQGAIIECGCFLGGAAAFMGLMRRDLNLKNEIVLFDTFEGAPIGSTDLLFGIQKIETPSKLANYEEQVKINIKSVLGSLDGFHFHVGLVEDTLPKVSFDKIALLRLDTDFYPSTKIELELLYPSLVPGGVLIVDDYGMFAGSRQATDEYFDKHYAPPLLNRVDGGIWTGVKPNPGPRWYRWLNRKLHQ